MEVFRYLKAEKRLTISKNQHLSERIKKMNRIRRVLVTLGLGLAIMLSACSVDQARMVVAA